MPPTSPVPRPSDPVRFPETFGPHPVKAGLRADFSGHTLNDVTHQAVIDFHGSVKATAYALGEGAGQPKLDERQMQREFSAGDFRRLKHASVECCGFVARRQFDAFGPMALSPKQHTEQKLDQIQAALNEVRQFIRDCA